MIAIIGAGPTGCYLASLLAQEFEDVHVFEEHASAGRPVQCAGIVTQEIFRYAPRKNNFVKNKTDKVRIHAPNGKSLSLKLEKPDIIIDRETFDNYFYKLAKKKGVRFYFNHRLISAGKKEIKVKNLKTNKTKKIKYKILIGADGPRSTVARTSGTSRKKDFFIGLQAVIKKKNNNTIDFYPSTQGFGWAVPEDKNALRVGFASQTNPEKGFNDLLRKYKGKIIQRQAGLIPLFNPWKDFENNRIFLIGDAAGFVKATTGGGLVTGLKSAEILAHSLKNNLSYKAGIYLHLYSSLWLNLKMRELMNSLTKQEWNWLIKELQKKESRDALQNINRDKLFRLLTSTIIHNPRIIKPGLRHLRSLL